MKSPRALFALTIVGITLVLGVISFFWLPHDPAFASASSRWLSPSLDHLLGTDGSGRDIASRIMVGSQITVIVALGTGVVLVIGLVVTALVWVTGSSAARRARLAHQPIEPGSQRGDRAHVAPASTRAAAG